MQLAVGSSAANDVYNTVNNAIGAIRKRRGGSRTRTVTKKPRNQGGGSMQWTSRYASGRFGKLTSRKIDKLSTDKVILTHRMMGPFNDYGQRFMYHNTDTPGNCYYPLVLMELNSMPNYINGVRYVPNPVHQMFQRNGGTTIAWEALNGQAQDGTTLSTGWQVEQSVAMETATGSTPHEESVHTWSSIDLECWGQTAKPTKYTIMLVQLNEDVCPNTTTGGQYNDISDPAAVMFWQSLIKQYTYSPLAKMEDGYNRKKMKIMKQYTFTLDPTTTIESDPDPNVKTMKLYYKFNRQCNFAWRFSNNGAQTIGNMNDADWNQNDGLNTTNVHPNARLFVMIRASNYQRQTTPTNCNNTNTPSISWRLRSAHIVNN